MPLTQEQKFLYGVASTVKANVNTAYLDLFSETTPIVTSRKIITHDLYQQSNQMGDYVGRNKRGKQLKTDGFKRYNVQPDMIDTEIPLDADEMTLMQAGEPIYVMGSTQNSSNNIKMRKVQAVVDGVRRRMNNLCAEVVINGVINLENGDTIDYNIPAIKNLTYDSSNGIVKHIHAELREYFRVNGQMPTDIMIGKYVAEKILEDPKFQDQVYKYNQQIADLEADEKAMIIGTVLSKKLKELMPEFDEKGTDITLGSETDDKMIFVDRKQLFRGFAGVPVTTGTNDNDIEMIGIDLFVDSTVDKRLARKLYFGKSAFVPLVAFGNSIRRFNVQMA